MVTGSRWGKCRASHGPEPSSLWDWRPPPEVPTLVRKGAGPGQSGSAIRVCESSQSPRGRPEKAGRSGSLPRPCQAPPPSQCKGAAWEMCHCRSGERGGWPLERGGSLLMVGALLPCTPPFPGRWVSARWKPPPALDPLSAGASRGNDLLQVGPSGLCSSFSALAEHSSPSTIPHTVPSSFLEGSGGFPFFSCTKESQPT